MTGSPSDSSLAEVMATREAITPRRLFGRRPALAPVPTRVLARVLACVLCAAVMVARVQAVAAETPRVVVSILPVHSLVAAVMAGRGAPQLLIRAGASPHDASLRPSDARALSAADLVIWVGPGLETFLEKPLAALAGAARVIALTETPGLRRLGLRAAGAFEPHGREAEPESDAEDGPEAVNPHLWLDPENARRMVAIFAAALAETDPDNAEVYRANATRLAERLDALDAELRERLAPVRQVPHLVFHDAYAYFAARYGLNQVGAFAANPEIRPGARHLSALRGRIGEEGVACVFIEPQFSPALVEAVTDGTAVRVATLDPLGVGLAPGPEAYFRMMRALADDLVTCLKRAG
jgi:zinc transport system substrate-binding protein